jgi:hypothetical protein
VEAARFDTCYRYDKLTRVLHDYALSRAGCQPISPGTPASANGLRGVVCEIELPEGATLIGDTPRKVP